MCYADDGTLVEFSPSCDEPMVGSIEPDIDYKSFYMFVYPTCEKSVGTDQTF